MRYPFVAGRAVITVMIAIVAGACTATPTSPSPRQAAPASASGSATSTAIAASPSASPTGDPSPSAPNPAGSRISRIQVGEGVDPRWFAADGQSLWVHEPTSLVRVDLATARATGQVPLGWQEYGYDTTGAGAVWQTDNDRDTLMRIDPTTGLLVRTIPLQPGSAPAGVVVTAGSVWVADEHGGAVTRIDPKTGRVIVTIPVGPIAPNGPQIMTAGPGGVWVGIQATGENVRVDAATNTVGLRVPLDGPVASDGKEVWIGVLDGPKGLSQVVRIDPVSGKVITTVQLDTHGIGGMAVGLGSVWVNADPGLLRIDPATGRIVERIDLDGDQGNVVVAGGAVWVTADRNPYVVRIAPE